MKTFRSHLDEYDDRYSPDPKLKNKCEYDVLMKK